jgi:hypothetical protein
MYMFALVLFVLYFFALTLVDLVDVLDKSLLYSLGLRSPDLGYGINCVLSLRLIIIYMI